MIRNLLRTFGVIKTMLVITAVSVLSSVLLYMVLIIVLGKLSVIGFVMSSIIPAIVSPLASYFILRVLHQLDIAEESLRESDERFRKLSEAAKEGIVIHQKGIIIDANEALARMFGYELSEIIGMCAERLANLDFWRTIVKSTSNGYDKPYEGVGIRKDGSSFYCQVVGKPYKYQGETLRVSVLRDITEQKMLESQLLHAQKMEAIGTLAGGVAHDLNNVLSGIVSYPELLLMQLPEDSPLKKPIMTIKKAGEKAAAIVQDLLTLARRGVPLNDVVNLNDIISEYLKSPEYKKLISYHPDVEVEINLSTDILNILGSLVHLSKTVMNLVSNAAEAMADGGKILISTENRYIDRPVRGYDEVNEGNYVLLTVSDSGVGISSEDIGRIFEPFYTKKKMGRSGTGLGMAVVWGTIKDHKGYIDVQSIEGVGTTFTLYFPATRKELDKKRSSVPIKDLFGKGESVLVIDDVNEQREIAFSILSNLGYSVAIVSSGEEAVGYMKNNSVDLLVLDMIMDPGIDGLETYRQIIEFHPGQKAIIASGFSDTDRVKEVQRLGAGMYIKKPYTIEKLGLAIKSELNK